MSKNSKIRDLNIFKNFKKEIDLSTKVIKDKKKYNRKVKHKNQDTQEV